MMKEKYLYWIGIIVFAGILIFLTLNRHSKHVPYSYHSEIYADKAGYYVYLPALIKYQFNPHLFPDSIDIKTGNGFVLDYENNLVLTKYTSGVSILQLPFFLLADILAKPFNFPSNGFSLIYQRSISIASVFYLLMALVLLSKYLSSIHKKRISILVVISIFFGTNLYYYSIDDTGMSHIYSFFLFSFFLYLLQRTAYLSKSNLWGYLLFGLIAGLIILIRPTNIIFLSSYFFLDIKDAKSIIERLKRLFYYKTIIPAFLGALFIITPQLIYWNFTYGEMIRYSYANEGFNWLNPQLIYTWFSPTNGLFLYTPFYLLLLIAMFYMLKNNIQNYSFIIIVFFGISYLFSAWWDWSFGCSFGARSYVEYLAIFSIPLSHFYSYISSKHKWKVFLFATVVFAFILLNLKMTYSYDGCFYGKRNWDWPAYYKIVTSPTK